MLIDGLNHVNRSASACEMYFAQEQGKPLQAAVVCELCAGGLML